MQPESWPVPMLAVVLVSLGVCGAALSCVANRQRRRREQLMVQRWKKLADQVIDIDKRITQQETSDSAGMSRQQRGKFERSRGRESLRADAPSEARLIAVPSLDASPGDRELTVSALKERHAAIWALADNGAAADVIARATGQPIGQIELILGLRRSIDGPSPQFSPTTHE